MRKQIFEMDFHGRKLVVEHGQLAKQADGAVLVRYGDTAVLTATVVSKTVNLLSDFFPLTVNYQEKLYSVGKIPGGFIKREGRASEAATLAARLIDRPMRPLFPEDFKNEVQIISTVLSVDPDCDPALTAMIASSLAVSISKIPFNGPIAGVKVGRVDGKLVINPTVEQSELSDINLTVAGTKDAINMVESSAKQVKEDDMLEALLKGHEAIKELVEFEESIIKEIGVEKMEYETLTPEKEIVERVEKLVTTKMNDALHIKEKLVRYQAIDDIKEEVVELYTKENEDKYFSLIEKHIKEDVPLSHLVGFEYFYDRKYKVTKDVLSPRMETEELIYKVIEYVKASNKNKFKILDLCTGSGIIAITLKKELDQFSIDIAASDVSEEAIEVAKENAQSHDATIKFIKSDIFNNIDDRFDIIVSNPPYIDRKDEVTMKDNVLKYDPHLALFAEEEGMYFYRKIIEQANDYLNENGVMFFEIGYDQKDKIIKLADINGYSAEVYKDINGRDRMAFLVRK